MCESVFIHKIHTFAKPCNNHLTRSACTNRLWFTFSYQGVICDEARKFSELANRNIHKKKHNLISTSGNTFVQNLKMEELKLKRMLILFLFERNTIHKTII